MARRKGKSTRRIKDWYSRFVSGEEETDPTERRQKVSPQAVKLPPDRLAQEPGRGDVGLEDMPKADGMVVGLYPGGAAVRIAGQELLCSVAKTFRAAEDTSALAVGDDVTVALTSKDHSDASDADRDRTDGMIISRGLRRSALARPRPRSSRRRDAYGDQAFDQVIAANIDVLLIMAATRDPPLRHGLIDRYLIIAERGELTPVLVLNKIDLGRPDETVLADFEALGIDVFLCSAETGEGVESLASTLTGKRSVVAGASGVGKTTLINRMIPGADAATQRIRTKDGRGRHTTTAAVVYDLPGGGMIVDTPGIRELGMQLQAEELPWYFPEFEALAPNCRFNDCTHTHESDCAIQHAVKNGQIPQRRYNSYLNILATLDQ